MNKHTLSFTGSGDEYFKIWISNIALSIITLGVYSAWATVRNRRYFYGNTWLDDANFEYHATPTQILFGRVVALILFILYNGLAKVFPIIGLGVLLLIAALTPWVIWRSMQFRARMTSYRNVRFSFDGSLKDAYKYYFWVPLVPILIGLLLAAAFYASHIHSEGSYIGLAVLAFLTIYLMIPYWITLVNRYRINYSKYGQGRFHTDIKVSQFYLIYLKWIGVGLLGMVIPIGIVFIVFIIALIFNLATETGSISDGLKMTGGLFAVVGVFLLYIYVFLWGIYTNAYLKTQMQNYILGHCTLDNSVTLGSTLTTIDFFKLLAGNFLLIALTMGIATPWVKVRLHKFLITHTVVNIDGELEEYVNQQQAKQTALGQELGDVFDLETGFEVGL